MENIKVGYALTGSFCTFSKTVPVIEELVKMGAEVFPIMSHVAYSTDTRFGTCQSFIERIEGICGKEIIHTIKGAEPIGPKKLLDVLVVAPCTGNTLGKLAGGITDTSVTMAAKAHLRNGRPLILAVSTNDALGTSARNIGQLLVAKNIYLVPMKQDDCISKPNSIVADFSKISETIEASLKGVQCQPVLQ